MITCSATFALAAALLAAQPTVPPPASAPTPPSPAPGTSAPASPGAPAASPEQIIRDLEKQAGQPGGAPTQPGTPAAQPASAQPPAPAAPGAVTAPVAGGRLLREGTFLTNRKGRLVRGGLQPGSGGTSHPEWLFTFENTSTEATAKSDPVMILMPCQNLMAMEKLFERGGESLTFTVSGQVFVYHGRNHLLPTMFTVNRRGDLSPAQ